MLSAKILRVPKAHGPLFNAFEQAYLWSADVYQRSLAAVLRLRWLAVGGGVLIVVAAVFVFTRLKREFVPPEDRGFFTVVTVAPEGATLAYTDGYQRQIEATLARTADIQNYFSIVGFGGRVNGGIAFVRLADWSERDRSVQDVITEIRPQLMGIPGVFAFPANPPAFGFGSPVQFVVRNPEFDQLAVGMDTLVKRARQIPGLVNVDTDLRVNKPELTVSYDRERAEDLGVPIRDVANSLQALLGGQRVSTFTRENKLYDVIVQLDPTERATPADMTNLYLRGRDGSLVAFTSLATVAEGVGPRQVSHFNRVRSATLTASLAPGFTLGEALDSIDRVADEVLPRGSSRALAGESRELDESGTALYFAFVLALVAVYLVLAAQFESVVHPFTVLLSVPLAVTGALLTLLAAGSTLNLYSQIGMILLIGLVTKNSILLVEYANQLMEKGRDAVAAVLESGRIRFRPIIMTSVSTVVSAIPIALGLGAGSVSRRPLGYAITGGVLFSTLLTLYLVPVVYVLFEGLRARAGTRQRTAHLAPVEVP
jgi:multidrug efflux pump